MPKLNLTQFQVPPEGPLSAAICLCGEAGGADEALKHRPFVGRTGTEVLEPCLSSAGLMRGSLYITNVIKEHPRNNVIEEFIDLERKTVWESSEYLQYLGILREELSRFQGNVIVALGDVALYALTGHRGILRRRGSVYPSTLIPGKKVLACLHPASALRQYSWKYLIIRDLQIAKEESGYPEIRLPKRTLRIDLSVSEFLEYIDTCVSQGECGFDIESNLAGQVTRFGIALSPTDAVSFPTVWKGHSYLNPEQELEVTQAVCRLIENRDVVKIGQNLTYDASVMWWQYGSVMRNIEDTMIAGTIINPDYSKGSDLPSRTGKNKKRGFPVGLAFLASFYTREPYWKDEGKQWKEGIFDDEEYSLYNAKDAAVTWEVWNAQKEELVRMGNWETYKRQRDTFYPLLYASVRGRNFDKDLSLELRKEAVRIIDLRMEELHNLCGFDLNPNSHKQVKEYFYGRLGLKAYKSRKTKSVSVDEEALSRLATKGYNEANLILEIRELKKLIGTYYDATLGSDGRMRTSYNPAGTETGRTSSAGFLASEEGTNLQNQPPSMKRCFISDRDCILVEMDKARAENTIVAYISEDPNMLRAIREGIDMHSLTASSIYNKPIEEISRTAGSSKYMGGNYSERDDGKHSNHSFNYYLSAEGFSLRYKTLKSNAVRIRDGYFRLYKNVPAVFWAYVQNEIRTHRSLTNLLGRTKLFLERMGRHEGDDIFRTGYAFIPQSTVADMIILGKNKVWELTEAGVLSGELLGETHDSITMQFPIRSLFSGEMAQDLHMIRAAMEPELIWKYSRFVVGTDMKIGLRMLPMKDVPWGGTPEETTNNLTKIFEESFNDSKKSIR
jgi:uracil-DNA glycosylase family 4